MKNVSLFFTFLASMYALAQSSNTSFEVPGIFSTEYIDTGDPNVAHNLIDNQNEPYVNFPASNGELGYSARYEPYDTPGIGLTDGDDVGVTDNAPSGNNPFPQGLQGYQISDVDGNFILEFDPILATSPTINIDYFIAETGYEGDGTLNVSTSDRLRIYVKDLGDNIEYDLLNTTGNDINDLNIEGAWNTASISIEDSPNITIQLIIEARNNSSAESFYFDNITFQGELGINDNHKNQFQIYPNPATTGYLNIISSKPGEKSVIIFDILGKQVNNSNVMGDLLDISNLSSGIYLLKITQGISTSTKKLIIQ